MENLIETYDDQEYRLHCISIELGELKKQIDRYRDTCDIFKITFADFKEIKNNPEKRGRDIFLMREYFQDPPVTESEI